MTKENLINELTKLGIKEPNNVASKLEMIMEDTLATNKEFNLTAIKDEEKFRELMLLDSVYPYLYVNFDNKKIIDVGTGAGYPGMVLATLSNSEITLLDSTGKKVEFCKKIAAKMGYNHVNCVCDRAESYVKNHRETYDIATARAVSDLRVLLELVLPLIKVNGYFIALKGSKGLEELNSSKNALEKLGAVVEKIDEFELPESKEKRINIVIKKIKETPIKYPREYAQIVKKPL